MMTAFVIMAFPPVVIMTITVFFGLCMGIGDSMFVFFVMLHTNGAGTIGCAFNVG